MKITRINIDYEEYESRDELKASDKVLLEKASTALGKAYAPYSRFHVGAAIRLTSGKTITGTNQENIAYPSGLCAERVAIFYASSEHPGDPVADIAITAGSDEFGVDEPVMPCGACRQVLAEYESLQDNKIRLILAGQRGRVYVFKGLQSLLPMMFKFEGLIKK